MYVVGAAPPVVRPAPHRLSDPPNIKNYKKIKSPKT
jgi:hypothetical protein